VRTDVYDAVRGQLLTLAGDKYGTHVVCKSAEYAELRVRPPPPPLSF